MWYNPIIKTLLRSPLHGFVSKNMMLMTYTGRKSGRQYEVPMNYFPIHENGSEFLATTSKPERVWWRNLRNGAEVRVLVRGKTYPAYAVAYQAEGEVGEHLHTLFHQNPGVAKYFDVKVDSLGVPDQDDVARLAGETVFIRTEFKENS